MESSNHMESNRQLRYRLYHELGKNEQTQETTTSIEIRHHKTKSEFQVSADGATCIVFREFEYAPAIFSFLVETSDSLYLKHDLQATVPYMLSGLDLCSCILPDAVEGIQVALGVAVENAVGAGYNVLQIVVEIEDLVEVVYSEEEVLAMVADASMDVDGGGGEFGATPASRSSIESLITEVFDQGKNSKGEDEDCRICLDEFLDGMEVIRMPCSHAFHRHCITRWLEQSNKCPLCRQICN